MKLGEYIESNQLTEISIATDVNNLKYKKVFYDISTMPVRYWNAEVVTLRHNIQSDVNSNISVELIAIIKE